MASQQTTQPLSILHLEDDVSLARKINQKLIDDGFDISIELVRTYKDFLAQIEQQSFQIIFLDDHVPDGNGLQALKVIQQRQLPVSVVMFSDILDEVAIVDCMRLGAVDYVLKTNLERLPEVVRQIVSENQKQNAIIDFQKFFETSADLLCACDKHGHFISLNQAWSDVLGFPVEELRGKPFLDLIFPDDRAATHARYQSLFTGNRRCEEFTACFVAQSGDMRWLQWSTALQTGEVIYAIARDITELKQNEIKLSSENESLIQQVEQYKVEVTQKSIVADQIHDSVITTDLKGIITSWNHGSEKVFGYPAVEVVGQHIALVYPEKDYRFVQEQAANILLEQGTQDLELQMRRKSGEVFDARLSLGVTRDHSGEVNGMVGYAVDLGPVNAAGQDANITEQRLESIIEASPVVTYACDWQGDHVLHYVSSNIEVLLGFPADRSTGLANFLLNQCHPDDREQLQKALDNLPETESFSHAYRFKKADGEYSWVHNELRLLKNSTAEPLEIIGMLIDVEQLHHVQQQMQDFQQVLQEKEQQFRDTQKQAQQWEQHLQNAEQQRSQLEKELLSAQQSLLQQQNEEKSAADKSADAKLQLAQEQTPNVRLAKPEFLSSISHELRVTLNAILGFAQIMALDEKLDNNNRQYLQEIADAGDRLLGIVTRTLDAVNLDTGAASLIDETFKLSELLDDCLGQLADAARDQDVELIVLPGNAENSYAMSGDKQRLQQVLLQVLTSAINNAPRSSKLKIGLESQQGEMRIAVRNSATGESSESQAGEAPATMLPRRDANGINHTGIESLITQTLLQLMGGSIHYEFDPDKVIAITIPGQAKENTEAETIVPEHVSDELVSEDEKTILYIEDSPANIRLVETLLQQRSDCRLVATRDPAQCRELVERYQPCLLLLDLNLPEFDSFELLARWRQDPMLQDIPVVAVTTDTLPDEIDRIKKAGAAELLAKPIEINGFLSVVDSFITSPEGDALKQINS
jgi:PAS domain S-box-containing protein